MGNAQTKVKSEKATANPEDEHLKETVDELIPKAKPLKSVKKPKGPKGRKPPSRTFLHAFVNYFQKHGKEKDQSENIMEETEKIEVKNEPKIEINLDAIENVTVLESVTKGRPAPPSRRRRPTARVKPTLPRKPNEETVGKEEISDTSERVRSDTKTFLKPPKKSPSKLKTIGVIAAVTCDKKTDVNNVDSEEKITHSSEPPGKPPRTSLQKMENIRLSSDEKILKPEPPKSAKPNSNNKDPG